MKGDRLTVVLNGETVIENAELPGLAARGPSACSTTAAKKDGKWTSPPAWCSSATSRSPSSVAAAPKRQRRSGAR